MLSDPLALNIGEIRVTALVASYSTNGFSASVFTFQSDASNDIDSFGAVLGYDQSSFTGHLG